MGGLSEEGWSAGMGRGGRGKDILLKWGGVREKGIVSCDVERWVREEYSARTGRGGR
jgi:hypothetical protein